jgi:hypothetical protein
MSKTLIAFGGVLAFVGAVAASGAASAHHSYAMFDSDKTLTVAGTVQAWQWTNPHSFLDVVDTASGEHWSLETASPSMLSRTGLTRNSFKPGDKVTVKLHPRRDAQKGGGSLMTAQTADGKVLIGARGEGGPRPTE